LKNNLQFRVFNCNHSDSVLAGDLKKSKRPRLQQNKNSTLSNLSSG